MENKPTFSMLIGVPASGKSYLARRLQKNNDDAIYLSSDLIRLELYGDEENQGNPSDIFSLMTKRAIEALRSGKDIIWDATNINRRRRKGLLLQLPRNVKKVAHYMSTEYKHVIKQNENRDRFVPVRVIDKMYKTLHLPIASEGWDEIITHYHPELHSNKIELGLSFEIRELIEKGTEGYNTMILLRSFFEEFDSIYNLPHDSTYHKFSVSEHIIGVYKYVLENWSNEDNDMEIMLWTALLHDIGKGFCKSFTNRKGEKTKYANFIGHENVGSQMATQVLYKMNFDDRFIHDVSTLVQFHMYLLNEKASTDKLKNYVGEKNYNRLAFLREADTSAH